MTSPVRTAGKRGCLPKDPEREGLVLDEHLAEDAPPVPAVVDWMSAVREWPMYGNDEWGDCVWAGFGHVIESLTQYAGGSAVEVTTADLLAGYSAVTGFDPNAGPPGQNPSDQGTRIADGLDYWRRHGIAGHKILAHAEIRDSRKIKAALNVFGMLVVGVRLPESAQAQFEAHQPWTVVHGSAVEGGHCIVVGRIAGDDTAVTWAATQEITVPWWATYVDEVHAVISREWLNAAGRTPSGLDLAGLGRQFTALTGQPDPFRTAAARHEELLARVGDYIRRGEGQLRELEQWIAERV